MDGIKRIYLGLPESIKCKVVWVGRQFRTNPLSHEPGGSDVIVEYFSGSIYAYDWIKFPSRYISKIWDKGISETYFDYNKLTETEQLKIIKENIKRIFARKYRKETFEDEPFSEIWNSDSSTELPWKVLEKYDEQKLDEYLERQIDSEQYETHLIKQILEEIRLSTHLEQQEKSEALENHLVKTAVEEHRRNGYFNRKNKK